MKFEWTCFSSVTLWTKKGHYEKKKISFCKHRLKRTERIIKNKKKKIRGLGDRIERNYAHTLALFDTKHSDTTLLYGTLFKKNLCFLFKGFPYWSRREGQFLGWYLIIVSFSFQLMVIMMSFKKSISIFDQGRERERERMEGSLNSAFFFSFSFSDKNWETRVGARGWG